MSPFWKDIWREITTSRGRFVSLVVITLLGAASVVGIQAASIDMRDAADAAYKAHNLYDIQVKSSVGLTDDDIAALRAAPGVETVMSTTSLDVYVDIAGVSCTVRTHACPDGINTLDVLEGRLPERAGECALEARMLQDGGYAIGDVINLSLDDMGEYYDAFRTGQFTVVGAVASPLYISRERGYTALGGGSISYYLFLAPEAYALDVYTDSFVLMRGSQQLYNLSEHYNDAADGWAETIKMVADDRTAAKRQELEDAWRELADGEAEYRDGYAEFEENIADAGRELEDARRELADAKKELEDGQRELDEKIADGQASLDSAAIAISEKGAELQRQIALLDQGQAQIDAGRVSLQAALAQLGLLGPEGVSPELDAQYAAVRAGLAGLDGEQQRIDAGRALCAEGQNQLDGAAKQLDDGRYLLQIERDKAQAAIDDGWAAYNSGSADYRRGASDFNREKADAERKLADARTELDDAAEKLRDVPDPEWYVDTREDGLAYDSYYQDTLRLQKIGYVFPMVFFLVAILVSLTTMSRMVEERRTQIGIYKAMGYRPAAITAKYLVYALGASLTGGALGVYIGSKLFPWVITNAYGHLYNMPPAALPIPAGIGSVALFSAVAAVVGMTLAACASSMRGTPAALMRPKAPRPGKRVLIERIPLIWNRLGFLGKVTARNIFRYKRRFVMTLVGVAGCTALLLTAFGLRDSVGGISRLQYGDIVLYDTLAYLKDMRLDSQRADLDALLPADRLYIQEQSVHAGGERGALDASLVVPEDMGSLSDFIALRSPRSGDAVIPAESGVLISEKLALVMGVGAGDRFEMTAVGGEVYPVTVAGVVENYVLHYIYMPPAVYADLFGELPVYNGVLIRAESTDGLADRLLQNSDVRAVVHTADTQRRLSDSTDALGIVTAVLLGLACALAFVVLYNLTNINISERLRELATIKVLGFQHGETAMYIYRESAVVTAMGVALGLILGVGLDQYVLSSVEINMLKFPRAIHPLSFVLAAAISFGFALIVNLVMSGRLRRINMVEALKDVE